MKGGREDGRNGEKEEGGREIMGWKGVYWVKGERTEMLERERKRKKERERGFQMVAQ